MRHLYSSTLCASLALCTSAQALTLSESTFGDFDNVNDPALVSTDIGQLDLGLNVIDGSLDTECALSGGDFLCLGGADAGDAFRFQIAPGEQLISVILKTSGTAPSGFTPGLGVVEDVGFTFVHSDSLLPFNTTSAIVDGVPLSSGGYVFGFGQGLASEAGRAQYDWSLTFEVSLAPVPMPAGLPLLISAFGVAYLLKRRQR